MRFSEDLGKLKPKIEKKIDEAPDGEKCALKAARRACRAIDGDKCGDGYFYDDIYKNPQETLACYNDEIEKCCQCFWNILHQTPAIKAAEQRAAAQKAEQFGPRNMKFLLMAAKTATDATHAQDLKRETAKLATILGNVFQDSDAQRELGAAVERLETAAEDAVRACKAAGIFKTTLQTFLRGTDATWQFLKVY